MEPMIMTSSGSYFNFQEPKVKDIKIYDIAHALSHVCRFGGHCDTFYSVAQHAVLVSMLVPENLAWQALHHDDAEAYLGDIPTPLKQMLPDFKAIEQKVEQVIAEKFGFDPVLERQVKIADAQALMLECESIVQHYNPTQSWACFEGIPRPTPQVIIPLAPAQARDLFINRYADLRSKFGYK